MAHVTPVRIPVACALHSFSLFGPGSLPDMWHLRESFALKVFDDKRYISIYIYITPARWTKDVQPLKRCLHLSLEYAGSGIPTEFLIVWWEGHTASPRTSILETSLESYTWILAPDKHIQGLSNKLCQFFFQEKRPWIWFRASLVSTPKLNSTDLEHRFSFLLASSVACAILEGLMLLKPLWPWPPHRNFPIL